MIIDSHLHIGLNGFDENTLLKYLDEKGIEKAWVLTWEEKQPYAPEYYIPLDIQLVKRVYKNHPDRIVPFYAPDPGREKWKEDLEQCIDEGFAGCGELKVPYRWDDDRVLALLDFLNHRKLPLIFHMEKPREIFVPRRDRGSDWVFKRLINERYNGRSAYLIEKIRRNTGLLNRYFNNRIIRFPGYLMDFTALENALKRFPDIKFVAHGPHFWNHFSIPVKDYLFHQQGSFNGYGKSWDILEKHKNLYCDISGISGFNALTRSPEKSKLFMETFNRKILFGSDNTGLPLLQLLNSMNLDPAMSSAILSGNAMRLLA